MNLDAIQSCRWTCASASDKQSYLHLHAPSCRCSGYYGPRH